MLKRKLSFILMAFGGLITIVALLLSFIGFHPSELRFVKVFIGMIGLLALISGTILYFIERKSLQISWRRIKPSTPQEFTLIYFGLVIGILFSVLIPYGAGFDEEGHLIRIFNISNFKFLPNQENDMTLGQFYTFSYQRRNFQTPAFDQFEKPRFFSLPDWNHTIPASTRATYFPANYIFPAVIATIFISGFNFFVLPVIMFMRFVSFLFYLFSCYFTLRKLPTGKWIFLVIAFTPMALFQATTLNADGFTLACSYLFIGIVLNVLLNPIKTINLKTARTIALVSVLVGFAKPGTILLLLLLLVFIRFRPETKAVTFTIFSGVLASVVVSLTWMFYSFIWTGPETYGGQLNSVLMNFADFLNIYLKGVFLSLKQYYYGWVGVYGYWDGAVPPMVYFLFPLTLAAAILSEKKHPGFLRKYRFVILIVSLICLGAIASIQFTQNYVPGVQIADKVSRYFLPFSSLLFLAFSGWLTINERVQKVSQIICIGLIVTTVGLYSFGLYRTYYTNCVYAVTSSQPCKMPVYKNLDVVNPYIAIVNDKNIVYQSFKPECTEISSVIIRVETATGDTSDNMLFSILDQDKNVISSSEFSISQMENDDLLILPIHTKVSVDNPTLWIKLNTVDSDSSNDDVGLLGRKDGKIYNDGILLLNNAEQDGDLFFQYTCSNP